MNFEKKVQITGAFDRRHQDPRKNYGIHGMEIRFVLIGPNGATHFVVFTPLHLRHVSDELYFNNRGHNPFQATGADIGYHSHKPMYDGQEPRDCEYLNGPCYYDGSGLQADEFMPTFLAGGDAAVWEMLEQRYRELFAEQEQPK